eukprot:7381320-Prymnesium_polylepis.1
MPGRFLRVWSLLIAWAAAADALALTRAPMRGDHVRVVKDVVAKGNNVKGWMGVITDTVERDETEWGVCCTVETDATLTVQLTAPGPTGYFMENELVLLGDERRCTIIEGDRVEVKADIQVKGRSALGLTGVVTNVWEICETDPACCCAELATDATHTVQLDGAGDPITYYFTHEEVEALH